MKCLKIGRHRYNFFLLFSVVGILFCSLSFSLPSFAIDDVSVTFDSSSGLHYSGVQVFYGTSLTQNQFCNDYKYLIIDPSPKNINTSTSTNVSYSSFYIWFSNIVTPVSLYSRSIISIPQCPSSGYILPTFQRQVDFSTLLQTDQTITLTLTDKDPYSETSCPDEPSGELAITSNGTYDVTDYASVDVNVPSEVVQGDYHNDLQDLKHSIIICGAILLVIYFFYCIYRMFFRTLGGV